MLWKDNMASLDYKSKGNNAKHIFPSITLFFKKKIKGNNKNNLSWNAWMLCNANPKKKKKKNRMVTKNIEMKHKDHVKKTQLD